ncbi:MAG: bifunctional transaldolase/phosoglucose isomerase [Ferruginibacter sp.]|nr:bifunctional transaldolase/phosoglucose isomerase [Cytophagales bacterium]
MKTNPLVEIRQFDQSVWLDFIRRKILVNGELRKLIDEDALRGVTSNPAIFEKAINGSDDYFSTIRSLALQNKSNEQIYTELAIADVQHACDLFRPVYDSQDNSGDGYVSLEVGPGLINDTEGTIEEGMRFWQAVDRPNVMIKVPATLEGLPAIRRLIAEGINVNVTLIFGLERYRAVADAFMSGLEDRVRAGQPIDKIASVASFFLSRIDVLIDPMLEKIIQEGGEKGKIAQSLLGEVAIASAKKAYQIYQELYAEPRFEALRAKGASTQRLLWASTGNKNPKYDDLKYVDTLIGPKTVNTIPLETLDIFREKGNPAVRLEDNLDQVEMVLKRLPEVGIDLLAMTQQLEIEGAKKFSDPFAKLMAALENKSKAAFAEPVNSSVMKLGRYQGDVDARLKELQAKNFAEGFWNKEASLWKDDPKAQESIRSFMGWLRVAETMVQAVPKLEQFTNEVKKAGFRHVVVVGMGGSTMTPIVFQKSFPMGPNGLPMSILDTTDPATIRQLEASLPLADTLFIVASKSGTTAEPLAFGNYFYDRIKALKGDRAGENFVAITDPGTPFVEAARQQGYREVFLNFADIGGRYSGLSYFGLVPAALYGIDTGELLERTIRMMRACGAYGPVEQNPGLELGVALGELARQGRDKLTLVVPPSLSDLGLWMEQLVAESTGKEDKGILPVAGESLGDPGVYSDDRVFAYVGLKDESDSANKRKLDQLAKAGHPIIYTELTDMLDLGQEFFRWEVAIPVAGAVLGINPFDQPNVQESKNNTDRLIGQVEKEGKLPKNEELALEENGLEFYVPTNADSAASLLEEFFNQANYGDYVSIQAYLTETPAVSTALQKLRQYVQEHLHVATTSGYGPRFLHSTGQYHKGGPNTGLFLQLTADSADDLPLPGRSYTFGTLKSAQAQGDLEALRKHSRRALRVDLGANAADGLNKLLKMLESIQVDYVRS